jgi:hypothetical protein
MKHYALCLDVQAFGQCNRCRLNPTRPENQASADDPSQPWQKPLLSRRGCASQIHAAPIDSEATS